MHAIRHESHGAVVIVRHLDDMSTRHLSQLFQALQPYHKLIFVGITGIGTQAIHHHLKLYGNIQQIPKMQLEMDLRDQVDRRPFWKCGTIHSCHCAIFSDWTSALGRNFATIHS